MLKGNLASTPNLDEEFDLISVVILSLRDTEF